VDGVPLQISVTGPYLIAREALVNALRHAEATREEKGEQLGCSPLGPAFEPDSAVFSALRLMSYLPPDLVDSA
jgi:hypothetical protein